MPSHRTRWRLRAGASSLEQRLKQFEDKAEIERLLLDYGRHLDARDFGAYAALFARDGEWVGGFGTVAGPANIKTFMEKAMPGQNTAKNYHLLSNFVIAVQGDTATAWSRWAFVVPGPAGRGDLAGRPLRRHAGARERALALQAPRGVQRHGPAAGAALTRIARQRPGNARFAAGTSSSHSIVSAGK